MLGRLHRKAACAVSIPVATRQIAAGSYSDGVTARGKKGPEAPDSRRQGINDFTGWFANDPNNEGRLLWL
jgi:hypothetical protein